MRAGDERWTQEVISAGGFYGAEVAINRGHLAADAAH